MYRRISLVESHLLFQEGISIECQPPHVGTVPVWWGPNDQVWTRPGGGEGGKARARGMMKSKWTSLNMYGGFGVVEVGRFLFGKGRWGLVEVVVTRGSLPCEQTYTTEDNGEVMVVLTSVVNLNTGASTCPGYNTWSFMMRWIKRPISAIQHIIHNTHTACNEKKNKLKITVNVTDLTQISFLQLPYPSILGAISCKVWNIQ